jgi:hypothetical protein
MRFQLVPSVLFYSGNDRWYCRDNKSFDRRELGPLAQLVEQFAFNELVAGSNPARPTISKPLFMWGFFFPRMSRMGRTDSQRRYSPSRTAGGTNRRLDKIMLYKKRSGLL